jgi:hypothetical protein
MRLVTAFALSFFFTLVIAALIFPVPPAKPKPLARPAVARTVQPVANPFEFLPPPPSSLSLLTSSSEPYEVARELITKGRLRAAQDQYLQILLARSLIDQKGLQGLARVQGLLAHGDPATLQRQANVYRQTRAGGAQGELYTARELELLAQANLIAAQQIRTEQGPLPTAVGSRAPIVSGIPQDGLGRSPTPARASPEHGPAAIVQQVVRLGSALNSDPAGSEASPVKKAGGSDLSGNISDAQPGLPGSDGSGGDYEVGSSDGGERAVQGSTESGRAGSASSWGSNIEGPTP